MNPAEIAQTLEVLGTFAKILNGLGVPGLVGLALAGPVLVLVAVIITEYKRSQISNNMVNQVRDESRVLVEAYRTDTQKLNETYRADTQAILRELGVNQSKTDQYYRDNVTLVQQSQAMASNLQDLVVSATRALERLTAILESQKGK